MLYYRFRPFSELSLKELMYSEMYFASPEECNDPFDSKAFYTFNGDIEKWVNFILLALNAKPKPNISGEQLQALTEYICKKCPLTFDNIVEDDIWARFPTTSSEDNTLIDILRESMPNIAKLYKPSTRYFVSFTKKPQEQLMWAHYANKYNGFCLIFRPINRKIKQFEFHKKSQIWRKTPKGIAPDMSFSLPEEFEIVDMKYTKTVIPSKAFLHMPVCVGGKEKNDADREKIWREHQSHYFIKGKCWSYEEEARIILSPPYSWLCGENIEYTSQERLFHYDPSHLVGIIYGPRLSNTDKNRIREIVKERRARQLHYPRHNSINFNFVEFQASLSKNERKIVIEPTAIHSYKVLTKEDNDFSRLYKEWQNGWGIETNGNETKKVRIG